MANTTTAAEDGATQPTCGDTLMISNRSVPVLIGTLALTGAVEALAADTQVQCTVNKQHYSFDPIPASSRTPDPGTGKSADAYVKIDATQKLSTKQQASVFRCGDSRFIKLSELTGEASFKITGTLFNKAGVL